MFGELIFGVDTFATGKSMIGMGNKYLFNSGAYHEEFKFVGVLSLNLQNILGIQRKLDITEQL